MKVKDPYKMNLQLFAEKGEEGTQSLGEGDKGEDDKLIKPEGNEDDKTFNQKELDEILAKRLLRERAKFEEDFKAKLETEKKEAEKLAKLSEAERAKAILDKQQAEFDQERSSFQKEKIELEVTKQLAAKSLPIEFANLLVDETAEISFENIATFEKNWQTALERAVKEKIAGKTPDVGGSKIESATNIKELADGFNIIK